MPSLLGLRNSYSYARQRSVRDQGGGVKGPFLRHNGALGRLKGILRPGEGPLTYRFIVPLVGGETRIEAWATSVDGSWKSERAVCVIPFEGESREPELYVLAVGINQGRIKFGV